MTRQTVPFHKHTPTTLKGTGTWHDSFLGGMPKRPFRPSLRPPHFDRSVELRTPNRLHRPVESKVANIKLNEQVYLEKPRIMIPYGSTRGQSQSPSYKGEVKDQDEGGQSL